MRTCRLTYRSTATEDALTQDQLSALLQTCVSNNGRLGITGMLLVSGAQFLQVLEGPPMFVNEVFAKIVQDTRHHEVELLGFEGTARRHFGDWSMRLIELEKLDAEQEEMFLAKYPSRNDVIEFPDDFLLIHSLLLDARYIAAQE